jgi:(p)ppGpp synthase/HD superfamily hydrolase
MLNAITSVISEQGSNIKNIGARTREGKAVIDLSVEVRDAAGLENITQGLKRIAGIHAVDRHLPATGRADTVERSRGLGTGAPKPRRA